MFTNPTLLLVRRWIVIVSVTFGASAFYGFVVSMAAGRFMLGLSVDDSLLHIGVPMFALFACFLGPRAGKIMNV